MCGALCDLRAALFQSGPDICARGEANCQAPAPKDSGASGWGQFHGQNIISVAS